MKKNIITRTCLLLGLIFVSTSSLSASWWSDSFYVVNKSNAAYNMAVHQDKSCDGTGHWTNSPVYPGADQAQHYVHAKISDDCETATFGVYVKGVGQDSTPVCFASSFRENPGHFQYFTLYYGAPNCGPGKYCCE